MTNLLRKTLLLATIAYSQVVAAQTRADGLAAMQLENWDKAISIYTALTKADAADQDAYLTLSNAYLAKGDKAKALELAKTAFEAKSEGAMAFVALGRGLLLEGKSADASEQFSRASKKGKKDIDVLRQIGESFIYHIPSGSNRPDLTRAVEFLNAALDYNSKDVPTLMARGYAYKEQGNGGMAAQNYELAEQLEPKNPLPKLMLAKVYKAAKIPAKFETYIEKVLALAPNHTAALRAKAEHFYFGRKWEQATQAYKDLVNKGEEVTIEDEMLLANCLYITKDCKGCSELVEKILQKDGSKNYLRRLQAYCDYDNGQYQRGLTTLKDYFKTAPADKIIASDYQYLGNLLLKTNGDTLEAISNFRKAISMDTFAWPLYKDIAKIYYTKRMNCESASAFEMYYDSVPAPAASEAADMYYWGLAQYYCKDDTMRYVRAEQTFKKITELIPTASIGWLWAAKAARNQDPSPTEIEANPELANQYGKAREYYEKYNEIAEADKEKNKKDLLSSYNYLSYCYLVKNESDKFYPTIEKWLGLETETEARDYIQQMKDSFGKDTPTPTPDDGGKGKN